MGNLQAQEMAEHAPSRRTALLWHLRNNHYPPHPYFMVDVAATAIDMCNEGFFNEQIILPEDVTFRGRGWATAGEIAEGLHLDPWIYYEREW